jgi:hypothetical protein
MDGVGSEVPVVPVPAHVVHEDMHRRQGLQDLLGEPTYFVLGGEVGHERVDSPSLGPDLPRRGLDASPISSGDRQVRSQPRKAQSGGPPGSSAAAGVLDVSDADDAFELFYGLVVRDTQIRVLLGERPPSQRRVRARAAEAVDQLWALLAPEGG